MESAEKALNLFLEEDEEKAKQTAEELKELNDLRKTMTENGVKEALGQAFEYEAKGDKVLVLYLPECHESIAGIIAGRIKDRLNHPAFVLTDAKEGIKGSGRSIEGYSMFEEMMKVKEVFTSLGLSPSVVLAGGVVGGVDLGSGVLQLLREFGAVAVADGIRAPAFQQGEGFGYCGPYRWGSLHDLLYSFLAFLHPLVRLSLSGLQGDPAMCIAKIPASVPVLLLR